ncbi:MAG: 50S ribosome-binding GTPase [Mycoplasmoidaceae bacterium]|nr:50S ribosome-binding GTPase [Mycoplasmoidaceae bacterium]
MLDEVVKQLDKTPERKEEESFKFCIIGRPNVGKSSLVNALIGQERVIVSPIANATRDSIDCKFKYHNKSYTIIDTAGIRRKGKMSGNIDKYSYLRTQDAISRADLIIVMLDGSEEFNEQDEVIAGLAHSANIPTIIVVNK